MTSGQILPKSIKEGLGHLIKNDVSLMKSAARNPALIFVYFSLPVGSFEKINKAWSSRREGVGMVRTAGRFELANKKHHRFCGLPKPDNVCYGGD